MYGTGGTSSAGVGASNKIVATLRADCKVYPTVEGTTISELVNTINYKTRLECDPKVLVNNILTNAISNNIVNVPTTDMGKQLLQCARDKDLKGVKNALTRSPPFTSDWLGMSALHFAAMNNQYEMCEVLLNAGINKDSKTKVDRTPLHIACFYGNEKIVEILLSRDCMVNAKDMLKMTPLHWAVEKGHKSIVRLLLKHNADVTITSKFGRTPVALAVLTEQADILEELEAARQAQINRKHNEEREKETSEAVSSIMSPNSDSNNEGAILEKSMCELVGDDGPTNANEYTSSKVADFKNVNEIGFIEDSTINLLKSHGISLMSEDEQASKQLLNTALQNGRQLILSEGGKLLLNETKKQENLKSHEGSSMPNDANSINQLTMPACSVKSEILTDSFTMESSKMEGASNENKSNGNIVKSKDHMIINSKGKNIRIISLTDFKKLYANSHVKSFQGLPTSLTANRLVKIRPLSNKQQEQQKREEANSTQVDNNNDKNQHKAMIGNSITVKVAGNKQSAVEEDESQNIRNTIGIRNVDSGEPEDNSKSPPPLKIIQSPVSAHHRVNQAMHLLHTRRLQHRNNYPQIRSVTGSNNNNNYIIKSTNDNKPYNNNQKPNKSSSTVIPLLTLPEVCRQLIDLRKQCEEFRKQRDEIRRLDTSQKELLKQNDELRKQNEEYRRKLMQKERDDLNTRLENYVDINQRVERLEELLLVEGTDGDIINS